MIPVPAPYKSAHTEALESIDDAQQRDFTNQPILFRLFRAFPTPVHRGDRLAWRKGLRVEPVPGAT
jgi:hypothetical protein